MSGGINGITDNSSPIAPQDANTNGVYEQSELRIDPNKTYDVYGINIKGSDLLRWLNGASFSTGETLDIHKFIELALKPTRNTRENQELNKLAEKLASLKTSLDSLKGKSDDLAKDIAKLQGQANAATDPRKTELQKQVDQLTKVKEIVDSEKRITESKIRQQLNIFQGREQELKGAAKNTYDMLKSAFSETAAQQQDAPHAGGGNIAPRYAANGTPQQTGQPDPRFAAPGQQQPMWGTGVGQQQLATPFTTNSYMNSVLTQNAILTSMDSIGDSQLKAQKMMMLFFLLARMAATGDLGAMYQFMMFITFLVSKDKALQNIDMGNKVIALQDMSRKNMQLLLDQDTSDPNKIHDFYKKMEEVKGNESAIAMSQKLISQMMEEMAQVAETLTGVTKATLDANGRLLRTVSRVG